MCSEILYVSIIVGFKNEEFPCTPEKMLNECLMLKNSRLQCATRDKPKTKAELLNVFNY